MTTRKGRKERERERGGREGERGRDGKRMKYIYYKYMVCMKLLVNTVLYTFLPHALYRERLQDMMLVLTVDTETTGKREREKILKIQLYMWNFLM